MRLKRKSITLIFFAAICVVLFYAHPIENSLVYFSLFSLVTAIIIIDVLITSYREGCLIGFFSIANMFIGLMFIVRPLQLLISGNINQFGVIYRYSLYHGYVTVADLPWAKAALIGLIGTAFLNIPFFSSDRRNQFSLHNTAAYVEHYKFSTNQLMAIFVFTLVASLSAGIYALKVVRSTSLHIYDLIWVFLFSCIFIYIIARKRTAGLFIYAVIGISILLLSFRGRRQYAVNMLLCYVCPLYFAGKDRKRTFIRVGLMLVAILAVVFIFGNVRRALRGAVLQDSFFEGILGEFSMFDMLLISLKYVKERGMGLFWGYNYLSIFTVPIPGITIQPFDHRFTEIIYLGRFHGGIPSSLFGSLFLNFSYLGVCLGALLFGSLLTRIQKKLSSINDYYSIGYYSIVATFVYDIVRVGDIGRETWSSLTFLLVYYVFSFVMRRVSAD